MNKYRNGKIYMITTENSNDIYIGSTIQTLKIRLQHHETSYRADRYCSSSEIIKQGKYKIVLIKNFACDSKAELEFEETRFQKDMVCVNSQYGRGRMDEKIKLNRIKNNVNKVKINCACGGSYSKGNKSSHYKTIKHNHNLYCLEYLKNKKSKTKYIFKIKRH